MPLNASIFGNLLNAPKSPEEYALERQQAESGALTNALNRQKVDEYTKGIERQNQLRTLLSGGADSSALRQAGFLDEASNWDKNAAEVGLKKSQGMKAEAEAQHAQLKAASERLGMIYNAASGAKDQQSYTMALQGLRAAGVDVSGIPDVFDPAYVENAKSQALTQMQRVEQALKQQQFGETVRHNKSVEGIMEHNNIRSNERMSANSGGGASGAANAGESPAKPAKPLPVGALKMQQDSLDAIGTAGGINADLGAVLQQVESGSLQLGPVKNAVGSVRNTLGVSNENSQNLATFKATLEKLRNDSLRLNKGVQTDGDAQRAWNELLSNINDPGVVAKRLKEIRALNSRAIELHNDNLANIRSNYGAQPIDVSKRTTQKPAIESAVKRINSDEEYNALPSGATFIAPDGKTRRKP